jgi:polyisoprenoid-binding protein YceI
MKKIAGILCIICLSIAGKGSAQIYMADSCRIGFFSAATIEDIAAVNTAAKPIMSAATNEIDVKINNQLFKFKKELMQEHFNEEYMETSKYQYTTFTGNVNEKIDYTKEGANQVTVTGTMDMHGVKKSVTIPGTITVQNGLLFLKATFNAKLADYNIKVPSVLGSNIAEQVAITITATMKPYNTKK